jgi:ATPase subunit of ABC transporter with duplicated ATPase domains
VILVSHDRRFLEGVTTRTIAFADRAVRVYEGGFADYMAQRSRGEAARGGSSRRSPRAK